MSQTTEAWLALYDAQTAATGTAILATVGTVATNKKAIISEVGLEEQIASGGVGYEGGWTLQMLASDFSAEPAEQVAITCNGDAQGVTLQLLKAPVKRAGIWYLTAVFYAAQK